MLWSVFFLKAHAAAHACPVIVSDILTSVSVPNPSPTVNTQLQGTEEEKTTIYEFRLYDEAI